MPYLTNILIRYQSMLVTIFCIQALIDQSVVCKQKVKHVCSSNALSNLSSWTDRNGVTNSYWSGDRNATDKGMNHKLWSITYDDITNALVTQYCHRVSLHLNLDIKAMKIHLESSNSQIIRVIKL